MDEHLLDEVQQAAGDAGMTLHAPGVTVIVT